MAVTAAAGSASTSPGLTSPGVGSGLDINGLVSKLMAVDSLPLTALQQKETSYQSQLSAYGTLNSVFSSLQPEISTRETPTPFKAMSATLADTTMGTVAAGPTASAGTYSIDVS